MIGPRPGLLNQLIAPKNVSKPAETANADTNTISVYLLDDARTPAQSVAEASAIPTTHCHVSSAAANQLLNSIAKNCFSKTATQKIGSEKNKNDTKVIE
jgi:hypothetical protein